PIYPLAQLYQNPHMTKTELRSIAHAKGLDQPVVARYWTWVKEAVLHKFGTGLTNPLPIWPQLTRVLTHTLELLVAVLVISVLIGVAMGIYSAIRQYSVFDYSATTLSF